MLYSGYLLCMTRNSTRIRCGNKYYEFSVGSSRSGKRYLAITETRLKQGAYRPQETLYVTPEYAAKFGVVLNMMLDTLENRPQAAPSAEISSMGAACCGSEH